MGISYCDGPVKTLTVGGAKVYAYRLVVLTAGQVVMAGQAAIHLLGSTLEEINDVGEPVAVRLSNAPGSRLLTASEPIAAGGLVTFAANGKVAAAGVGDAVVGVACTSAGADGDILEVILYPAVYFPAGS